MPLTFPSATRARRTREPLQIQWNARYRDLIGGLDILGVRQVDQGLELELVGGLTTVAPRARYLSLLTWALAALYERGKTEGGAEVRWALAEQNAVLTRLEFLVAVATQAGARAGEEGSTNGIVGSDVYRPALDRVAAEGGTEMPETRRPGALNAYGSPMQGFGLTTQADDGPLALTPRGQALIEQMGIPERVTTLLFDGDSLSSASVEAARTHLSLNGLDGSPAERAFLLAALDEAPPGGGSRAVARAERFRATRAWAIRLLKHAPATADGLVDRAYADLVAGRATSEVAVRWGEVALRKRVHYALELILSAIAEELEADRGSTVNEVLAALSQEIQGEVPVPELSAAIGPTPVEFGTEWSAWASRVADDAFLDTPPRRGLRNLDTAGQLVAAMALLVATERQAALAIQSGLVPDRQRAVESTLRRIRGATGSFASVSAEIARQEVASRHLRHTMRKMSQGQNNSLRFFPRGDRLVPTGIGTAAGFSLTRLGAVLQVLADLGHLEATPTGFRPTPAGLAWAGEARA